MALLGFHTTFLSYELLIPLPRAASYPTFSGPTLALCLQLHSLCLFYPHQ